MELLSEEGMKRGLRSAAAVAVAAAQEPAGGAVIFKFHCFAEEEKEEGETSGEDQGGEEGLVVVAGE